MTTATDTPRKVPAALMWRVAKNTLGRMACMYGDPARDGHDHDTCLRDDEAYAAERLLLLIAPAVAGDEDKVLDQMTQLLDAVASGE